MRIGLRIEHCKWKYLTRPKKLIYSIFLHMAKGPAFTRQGRIMGCLARPRYEARGSPHRVMAIDQRGLQGLISARGVSQRVVDESTQALAGLIDTLRATSSDPGAARGRHIEITRLYASERRLWHRAGPTLAGARLVQRRHFISRFPVITSIVRYLVLASIGGLAIEARWL